MTVETIFLIYFAVVNLLGFIIMGLDKRYAKREAWRIPEATLFSVAIFGGAIGSMIGMKTFRHKTKKLKFTIGMPAILIAQIIIVIIVIFLSPVSIRIL